MKMVIADRDRGKEFYAVRCGDGVMKGFAGGVKSLKEGSARGFVAFLLVTLVLVLTVFPFAARAAQVTLAWNASTGPNLAGYNVYYGTASGDYDWSRNVGNVTTSTISDLASGVPTYCFAVKAYNTSGQESAYSNEVCTSTSSTCSYSISPTSAPPYTASGGTGSVAVTTQSGCTWTASSGASWLTITSGASGSGNGTIRYSVAANTGTSSRSGSSTFARNVFSVTQAGTGTTPTQSSLVMDDGQSGTTAVGTWRAASSPSPYGTRSLYSNSTATYTFAASRSGTQAVYLWWTTHSSRSTRVPVRIYNGSTRLATVYVNQRLNGGRWNKLGTYTFSGQARVQITSSSGNLTTCADAVRFVP